jgi:serine/threonine protein kinase
MFDDALPPGTVVGEFEIRRVLGYGGFGIVYEAYEAMLDRRVALKEFFLRGFSRRDGSTVTPLHTEEAKEMFESGVNRFVREARLLSMLNERTRSDGSLVAVYRVFQANGTAFMAMKLYEGGTLKQWVKEDPSRVSEAWLVRVLVRLLDALDGLHSLPGENLVHRDVSPDNIILQPDGTPVLLDFGATRKANDAQTSLIFKPGYSPIEQYTDSLPQGPWTDLYALCGVAYFAVTGEPPMPAIDRHAGVNFRSATELGAGRFSPAFLALIDHGMAVLPDKRFRSCTELRAALARLASGADMTMPTRPPATAGTPAGADDDETTKVIGAAPNSGFGKNSGFGSPSGYGHSGPGQAGAHSGNTATLAWPAGAGAPTTPLHGANGLPAGALGGSHSGTGPHATPSTGSTPTPPLLPAARKPVAAIAAGVAALVLAVAAWQWLKPGEPGPGGPAGSTTNAGNGGGTTTVAGTGVTTGTGTLKTGTTTTGTAPSGTTIDSPSTGTTTPAQPSASQAATGAEGAASVVPVATTHTPVPGLKCSAEQADWPCVLDGLARLSTSGSTLQVKVLPERARIGDSFSVDVTPGSDGRLTVLGVNDRADGKLVLVFPNAADNSDRLHAGHALKLPRRPHWDLVAQAPTGRSYMVAVVTPAGLKTPPALSEGLSLKQAVAAFAAKRPLSLLGVAECTPGAAECPKSLAIRSADFIIE